MFRYFSKKISSANFRKILKESKNTKKQGELRVQDPYTLRCIPQIHGASKDTLDYVREIVSHYDNDRVMHMDIDAVEKLIEENKIVESVQGKIGELEI